MILFFVPGNPKSLKRHRTFRRGTFNINVDPSATDKADFLAIAMANRPEKPIKEPIELSLDFGFARPKSHYNNKGILKKSAPRNHISKPDIDNLAKFVLDALNGVFWYDDSYVVQMTISKQYRMTPGVLIKIESAYSLQYDEVDC